MSVKRCACGRDRRLGQQTCRACHAAEMKIRRGVARARGTLTVQGVHVRRRPVEVLK